MLKKLNYSIKTLQKKANDYSSAFPGINKKEIITTLSY